jgi:hypothetical protein
MNKVLSTIAERNPVVKAFVERNEQKIQSIRNKKIPNRQSKISYHKTRIAEIDRKSDVIGHKLERCVALSDTVKSFAVLGAERRQAFSQAMNKLNQSTVDCLNDKKATLNNKLDLAVNSYSSASVANKLTVQKDINKLQSQIAAVDGKIAKISSELPKSEAEIDTAMQNTANAVQTCIENGDMSVSKLSETACIAAKDENPFEYLKNTEMAIEDDYNSIDGIINNGSKEELEQSRTDILNSIQAAEDLKDNPFVSNDIKELAEQDIARLQGELAEVDKALEEQERNPMDYEKTSDSEKQDKSQNKNDGKYINSNYYKSLPKIDRKIYNLLSEEAADLMEKLSEQNIPFSAVIGNKNQTRVTVSKSNESKVSEILNVKNEKYINPEFYKSLGKSERFTQRMDEKSAKELTSELKKNGIEHSAVIDGDKSAVTVRKKDFKISKDFLRKSATEKHKTPPKDPDKTKKKNRGEFEK